MYASNEFLGSYIENVKALWREMKELIVIPLPIQLMWENEKVMAVNPLVEKSAF